MSHRTLTALTMLSAAVLLTTTSCTTSASDSDTPVKESTRSSKPNQAKATPAADVEAEENTDPKSVEQAPELTSAKSVVLRRNATQGNAGFEFAKAEKGDGDTLIVGVQCAGKGKLDVALHSLETSFELDCYDGKANAVENHFTQPDVARAGTVSITASSSAIRWSLAIGRGEAPTTDLAN